MKIKCIKMNEHAKPPVKMRKGDAGLDLYSIETVTIPAWEQRTVKTGLIFEIEEGYYVQIKSRSGLADNHKLHVGAGVIDSNYRGEVKIIISNLGDERYTIHPGERMAQMVIHKEHDVEIEVVESLSESERGSDGFGSSGKS